MLMRLVLLALAILVPGAAAQGATYEASVELSAPEREVAILPGENATVVAFLSYDVSGGLCDRNVGPGAVDRVDVVAEENATWLSGFTHRTHTFATASCSGRLVELKYNATVSSRGRPGDATQVRLVATPVGCGPACAHEEERVELDLTLRVAQPPASEPETRPAVAPAPHKHEECSHVEFNVSADDVAPVVPQHTGRPVGVAREVPAAGALATLALCVVLARLRRA